MIKSLFFLAVVCFAPHTAEAAVFSFGAGRNGLLDVASGVVTDDGLSLALVPTIAGSLLNERGRSGLGINSQSIAEVNDNRTTASRVDMNVLGGTGPLAGQAEGVTLSFDQDGLLTEIDFDGVKDETLKFFRLQSASFDFFFFDSAADPNRIAVPGEVVFLQEPPFDRAFDDRSRRLAIPFTAGEALTLTFGTLGTSGAANGARLQGVMAIAVPKPSARLLLLRLAATAASRRN